jgi:hypothetical protein
VLARVRRVDKLPEERVDEPRRRVDGEQRRVAGAGDAHVHDAALLLHLRGAPAGDVAVVVGNDDGVVFATLGGVDGADDDPVLLGLLARGRVVCRGGSRLLVGEQAVPGAPVRAGVRVGLGEKQKGVENLERAGAVWTVAVAGRGGVGLRGPEDVEAEGLDDGPDEAFGARRGRAGARRAESARLR